MSFSQGLAKIKENEESRAKSTPIAMVAPELKQNTDADTEITKTCAVLGCEESKNINSHLFFRFPEDESLRQIWTDLTGRNNWTPTDYSYICVQHFSVDCFECKPDNTVVLTSKAVPSLKLPKHVLEVEYIDEDTFDNETLDNEYEDEDYLIDSDEYIDEELLNNDASIKSLTNNSPSQEKTFFSHIAKTSEKLIHHEISTKSLPNNSTRRGKLNTSHIAKLSEDNMELINRDVSLNSLSSRSSRQEKNNASHIAKTSELLNHDSTKSLPNNSLYRGKNTNTSEDNLELLKLFTDVQRMQRQTVALKEKLKSRTRIYKRQDRFLSRVNEVIEMKKSILNQKKKKKSRILLSLQDKIAEDTNGLVLAMPTRHSDDLKNFALSIYKYSPQAYIYIRNSLRTILPSTEVLESWVSAGFEPKNVMSNSNLIKVASELTDSELSCKVTLR